MGNFYPKKAAVKLNVGRTSSITLYGEAARTVEKITLFTLVIAGVVLIVKALQ